jgi:hypothetical protein
MSLFERFAETKEEGFREEFIKPLLVKMGFVNISNKHGRDEFGKDYVFSEIDRFMHYRHMVVQAKHEKSIGVGRKTDELVSQVRRAFNVPYYLPITPHEERRVSAVYVFNSGKITEPALAQIRNDLREAAMQTNVHFLDGDHLEVLANTVGQRIDDAARHRLAALRMQLDADIRIIQGIDKGLDPTLPSDKQFWNLVPPPLHAVAEYMMNPIVGVKINIDVLAYFWQSCQVLITIVQRNVFRTIVTGDFAHEIDVCKRNCTQAVTYARQSIAEVDEAILRLPAVIV